MHFSELKKVLNSEHFIAFLNNSNKIQWTQTFVAESESPLLARLNVGYPQVVVVDEGYEVRVSGADLGVHTCPWALGLDLHRLQRGRLLNPKETILVIGETEVGHWIQRNRGRKHP